VFILTVHWYSKVSQFLSQKCPSEERVENELWKKVRKAEEYQYDFSSADIGKMQTGTTQRKSKG